MAERADLNLLKVYGLLRIAFSVLYLHTITESHVLINPLVYAKASWAPAFIAHWFGSQPPPPPVVAILGLVAVVSTVLMGVGLLTRWVSPIALVSGWLLLCLTFSFGKMTHNTHSLFIFLMLFQFSDWGTFFSVDALLRGKRLPKIYIDWTPQYLLWLFLGLLSAPYFFSGFFKVLKGHFWTPGYINTIIVSKQILWAYFSPIPAANLALKEWFLVNPWLGDMLAWLTLFVELAFFLVLASPGARLFMVALAVAFHASITLTTRILFFEHMMMMGLMLAVCAYLYCRKPVALTETGFIQAPTWRAPLVVFVLSLLTLGTISTWAPMVGGAWTLDTWMPVARALHAAFPLNSNYFQGSFDLNAAWVLLAASSVVIGGFALRFAWEAWILLQGPRPAQSPTLIYDADCGFCQQSVDILKGLGAAVTFVKNTDSAQVLEAAGVSFQDTQRYAIYLERQGSGWRMKRGAAAINAVLSRMVGIWPGLPLRLFSMLYPFAGIQQVQDIVYRWIANNRYWISKGACRIDGKTAEV